MQLKINRPNIWPNLQDEKYVYVISPAYPNSPAEIDKITLFLKQWDLKPILFDFPSNNHEPFLAQSDKLRLAELKNALYGNESNIIMVSRGGYGSARILPELLKLESPQSNKLLIGFSDITSLHLCLNNHWGLSSLHGPLLNQCITDNINKDTIKNLFNILSGTNKILSYPITGLNNLAKDYQGEAELPPLKGGNLTLIQTSIGTPWGLDKESKFSMLIEEYDEPTYAIDRSLRHLLHAGTFKNCEALFIGDISQKPDTIDAESMNYITQSFIPLLNIPIFRIKNIGHTKRNLAIPLGIPISISL
ncbi:MAG: LD-carboxypeptidase [Rickettsiales bacterium]|jgi:muramoyltetrapeptide carboxypeptidase|nr:LD-carboxypeptidase [Rickettsiales bacterium]